MMDPGSKVCFDLTVTDVRFVDGNFRSEEIYSLQADDGTRFRWRYTGDYTMHVGDRYRVRATLGSRNDDGIWRLTRGRFKRIEPEEPSAAGGPAP